MKKSNLIEFSLYVLVYMRRPLLCTVATLLVILCVSSDAQAQPRAMGQEDITIDAAYRTRIIDSVADALDTVYVFPDKAEEMITFVRKQLKDGKYDDITNLSEFTLRLTEDLQSISHDRHIGVRFDPDLQPEEELSKEEQEKLEQQYLERLRYDNFGFYKLERLPGNIGYLDLRQFADASNAAATAIAAMNFLAYCDAIIFDLRQNGGGSPSMIQLITSYFLEEPVHLNSFYIRQQDSIKQFWTQAHVQGPRMTETPIWVLTSSYTFSGAEEFTYNLKNLERATIIGETTGGGAHPVEPHTWPSLKVSMRVPFGRAINPITGTNWEGTGVEPHISVPADKALDVAMQKALKTLKDNETDERRLYALNWVLEGYEVASSPVTLHEEELNLFTGIYGPRKIWLEDGALYYQREGRDPFRLIPMGNDKFMLDELEHFRLQFIRDEKGAVTKLVGLYDNGFTDANDRTEN